MPDDLHPGPDAWRFDADAGAGISHATALLPYMAVQVPCDALVGQDPIDQVPLQAPRVVEPGQGRRVELVASLT